MSRVLRPGPTAQRLLLVLILLIGPQFVKAQHAPPRLVRSCLGKWKRGVGHQFNNSAIEPMHYAVRTALGRFFPGDEYSATHGLRFTQTLLLLEPILAPSKGGGGVPQRVLLAGEKGHFPVLVHQVLRITDFNSTSWDEAGSHSIASTDGTKVEFMLEKVNLELDRWPFRDELFDVIVCLEVLEHFSNDPMHALTEARRVLRPGGQLVVSTPNIGSLTSMLRSLDRETPCLFSLFMRKAGMTHFKEFSYNEVARALGCAGFDIGLGTTIEPYNPGLKAMHPFCPFDMNFMGSTLFFIGNKKSQPVELDMNCGLYYP